MKSTLKLGRPGDTDSSPHWSFLIVLFWVALTSLAAGAALALAVNATLLILAIFGGANLLFMALVALLAKRREGRQAKPAVAITLRRDVPSSRRSVMGTSAIVADEGSSFIVLPAHARADEMTRVLFAQQNYFPVAQGQEVVGVLFKGRLLSALARGQGDRLLAELMNPTSSPRPVLAS